MVINIGLLIVLKNPLNKFLEDILAHSKRSLKQSGALPNQNLSSQRDTLNNHQGQIQSVSSTSSVASSIQLPASNLIVINRTNEEKSLFPDKLILERYFSFLVGILVSQHYKLSVFTKIKEKLF